MGSTPELSAVRQLTGEQAYLVLERLRWGGHAHTCPHCSANSRCYLLTPASGSVRRTRAARRLWKCGACRRQFSVLTGTVLQGTRVPLPVWVTAVGLLAGPDGSQVTATDLRRATGLGQEAARHVIARWRAAVRMTDDASADSAVSPEARTERALTALLAIPACEAAAVRDRSPARRRPVGRHGPVLDLGGPDVVGPHDPGDGSDPGGPAARS